MKKDKISIITVSYNSINFIEGTIKNVLSQDYDNIEYIVIDGGSTDGTAEIIKKYSGQLTYWCSEKDKGIYDGMNKGIAQATGKWICFMNSGDTFHSNDVLSRIASHDIPPYTDVIYGDVNTVHDSHEALIKASKLAKISHRMPFCHQSCLVRRSAQTPYDISFRIAADYLFFRQLYYKTKGKAFMYIPLCIADMDCTDSISHDNKELCDIEYLKIRSLHKDFMWYYDKLVHTLHTILKK